MTDALTLPSPGVQTQLRLVAACILSALGDTDKAVRSQVAAGAIVDGQALAHLVADARQTLQLAETALHALTPRPTRTVP